MNHAWGYATDQRLRDENQDSHGVFVFPRFTLALVCDGMGGHVGGAQASALAVRSIVEAMQELVDEPVGVSLSKAIHRANQVIYQSARKNRRFMGMGTTVVAVALEKNVAHIAHVGDSRLYALRDGEAHLLTTDHTMVNLFVEAELLSREDAANHPEAHVLARSLGVEKTVEVDLQEPIELEAGDVLLLCSDGVHGPISDDALGRVEWSDLPAGCSRVLELVRDEHGDDNATVVALGVDLPSSPEVPPTPLPEPVALDEPSQQGPPATEIQPPAIAGSEATATIAPPMLEEDVVPEPPEPAREAPPKPRPEPRPEPEPVAARVSPVPVPAVEVRPAAAPRRRPQLVVAALLLVLVASIAGFVLFALPTGPPPSRGTDAVVEVISAEPVPAAAPAVAPEPTPEPGDWDLPAGQLVFAPVVPPPIRRPAHRAREYVYPPPGGPLQLAAIQASRGGQCDQALDNVRTAMKDSIDFGSLYDHAWECFEVHDAAPLTAAKVRTEAEFRELLPHFRGVWLTESPWADQPQWYRPARAGIEYRIEGLEASNDIDRFREVTLDRLGPGAIADVLARDLMLEAQAAAGLSTIPDPSEEVVGWWARRVYVTTRTLRGPLAEILTTQRPEIPALLTVHLDTATHGAYSDRTLGADLPEVVQEALAVGLGELEAPKALKPPEAPRPVRPSTAPAPTEPAPLTKPVVIRHGVQE